jgi:hypothetical protein
MCAELDRREESVQYKVYNEWGGLGPRGTATVGQPEQVAHTDQYDRIQ